MDNLSNRKFIGIIKDYFDESEPTKYFVDIPELTSHKEPILVKNNLNFYTATKIKNEDSTLYSGSYSPLIPGTKVNIQFYTNEITSGYIESLHNDSQAIPPGESPDSYYLLMETPGGSRAYFDTDKERFHIHNESHLGGADIFTDGNTITLQTNTQDNKVASLLEISKNGFIVKFGERSLVFNESGFSINSGVNANTFLNMTDKGISFKGEEFLSFDTQKLNMRGETVALQSLGQLHIRGTVLNLTGTQKAALNSSVVHVEGWMSTYIKAGLTLNLESLVFYKVQSLINDELNLAMKHTFSPLISQESTMATETSTFKANAISTIANDGIIISNLGVASNTAPTVGTSMIGVSTGLTAAFMAFGTFLSLDNIASSVVGTVLTDGKIADSAAPATPTDKSIMGVFLKKNKNDNANFLNKLKDKNILNKTTYSDGVIDYTKLTNPSFDKYNYGIGGTQDQDLQILSSNFLKGQ